MAWACFENRILTAPNARARPSLLRAFQLDEQSSLPSFSHSAQTQHEFIVDPLQFWWQLALHSNRTRRGEFSIALELCGCRNATAGKKGGLFDDLPDRLNNVTLQKLHTIAVWM